MNKELMKQIDEMEDLITANTDAPSTGSASTDIPGTDAPGTEAPVTEVSTTETPSTDVPSTKAPTTEIPDDELSRLKSENDELRRKLAEKATTPKTDLPSTTVPTTSAPIDHISFIGDGDDLDEITRDHEKFNALLNRVYMKGVEIARDNIISGTEKTLKSIPDIVKNNIVVSKNLNELSEKFYDENKDLKPFKKVVALTFEEIYAKNPDKRYDQVLPTVAEEVRKKLNLHSLATKENNDPPRLPRKSAQPRPKQKPKTDPLIAEIEAMDNELNK